VAPKPAPAAATCCACWRAGAGLQGEMLVGRRAFFLDGMVLLLGGLERLIASFQAESGRLALFIPRCGSWHRGKSNSTSCPVQGHALGRHPHHSRSALSLRRALPRAADTKPQGRENTVQRSLPQPARALAWVTH